MILDRAKILKLHVQQLNILEITIIYTMLHKNMFPRNSNQFRNRLILEKSLLMGHRISR